MWCMVLEWDTSLSCICMHELGLSWLQTTRKLRSFYFGWHLSALTRVVILDNSYV